MILQLLNKSLTQIGVITQINLNILTFSEEKIQEEFVQIVQLQFFCVCLC